MPGWSGKRSCLLAALLGAGLSGCGPSEDTMPEVLDDSMLAAFVDTTLEMSPLVYSIGGETLNDRCPVRLARLNPRMPAIYVNQHPVGFC